MWCICGTAFLALLLTSCAAPTATESASQDAPAATRTTAETSPTASPATAAEAEVSPTPAAPVVKRWTVTTTEAVPFATRTIKDPTLASGTSRVRIRGAAGVKTLTYEITSTNGVQTGKRLLRMSVTKAPVTRLIAIGTKTAAQCDPNYDGACVPIASDVDCAGGSGNGPAYVSGPVRVIGSDIYGLDRDGDGIACE